MNSVVQRISCSECTAEIEVKHDRTDDLTLADEVADVLGWSHWSGDWQCWKCNPLTIGPGQIRWVTHPQLHRRGNPIKAAVVGLDPFHPDSGLWVVSMLVESWADRLFSAVPGDLADTNYD